MQLSTPLGPRAGGPGAFVQGLAAVLQRSPRVDLVVISPKRARGASRQRGSQLMLMLTQLWKLVRARPAIIHTHGHPGLLAAAVAYRALALGAPRIVFTFHIDPVERGARWSRLVLGQLLRHCESVTVFAHNSIEKIPLDASPAPARDRVHVIPAAATVRIREKHDPEVVAFAKSIGFSGGPMLLQVSNFVFPAKVAGTLRLLEALVKVRRHFPGVHLILLGTGPYVRSAQELRDRLGLHESVTIPGTFIEDLSLPAGLSDVHCHISLQDACPVSIVEAMHAAKPVVASRSGGIPELIQHGVTGVLVDNEPDQIADAIIALLRDPENARKMGTNAQAIARSRFTWERVAADFEAVYGAAPERVADAARSQVLPLVE